MYKWMFLLKIMLFSSYSYSQVQEIAKKYEYNKGSTEPTELLKNLIIPLKNGATGIEDSKKVFNSNTISSSKYTQKAEQEMLKNNGENKLENKGEIYQKIANVMGEEGKLIDIKMISKDTEKLNGYVQVHKYQIFFSNGKNIILNFSLLKSSTSGGFLITNITED